MKIDHIGIAVNSIENASKVYEAMLKKKLDHVIELPDRNLKVMMIKMGESEIELLQPIENNSKGICSFLEKKGEGLHHIAFKVNNFDETIENLKANGFRLIGEPTLGANGSRIIFLHPKSSNGTLIELCENTKEEA
ncbi:MAG: methylmalonyl-CoA epimerase [Caldisericia bacterium]|nr:methylmalonyl-CoA epimerase [Caldisericia bacterium]